MIKRSLIAFLLAAMALLMATAPASAVVDTGNGSGPTTVPGAGGGGGGKFTFYNLFKVQLGAGQDGFQGVGNARSTAATRSLGDRRLPWSPLFDQERKKYENENATAGKWRVLTSRYMRDPGVCGSGIRSEGKPFCPLWFNKSGSSSSYGGAPGRIQSEAHNATATGGAGIEGQIVAYNIRIWRENHSAKRMELIMERQLGVGVAETENNGASINESSKIWWYGGITGNSNGVRMANGTAGGSFGQPGGGSAIAAGPIGNGQPESVRLCRANQNTQFNPGIKQKGNWALSDNSWRTCYWEGPQMGPNPFHVNDAKSIWEPFKRSNSLPDNQFGPDTNNCDKGITCAGNKESFRFNWILPTGSNSNSPRTSFSYVLNGAPGLFYAVQIIGVDNRERIVPITKPAGYTFASNDNNIGNRQYFKMFMVTPPPPTECCDKPSRYEFSSDEPEVDVSLAAKSPVQTRQRNYISTDVFPDSIDKDSMVFPRKTDLYHFTPQLKYSNVWAATVASQGWTPSKVDASNLRGVYSEDYVYYEDLNGSASRFTEDPEFDYFNHAPNAGYQNGNPIPLLTKVVKLSKAGRFENAEESDEIGGDLNWNITWLQPTLDNPCPQERTQFPFDDNPRWPSEGQVRDCPQTGQVFNAWDDLLYSRTTWESQNVIKLIDPFTKDDARGIVEDQLLRCAANSNGGHPAEAGTKTPGMMLTSPSQSVSGKSPGESGQGGPSAYGEGFDTYTTCKNPVFALENDVINVNEQSAQGHLNIKGTNGRSTGSAFITLNTNAPGNVDEPVLEPLDEDGLYFSAENGTILVRNGAVNLNFCRQGLPSKVGNQDVKSVSGNTVKNVTTSGDPMCRGYVIQYKYKTSGLTANQCSVNPPANSAIENRWPTTHIAPVAGRYHNQDKSGDRARAYNDGDFEGAPFIGRIPGNSAPNGQNASFYADCVADVSGKPTKGNWNRTWSFQKISTAKINSNRGKYCRFSLGQISSLSVNQKPAANAPNGSGTSCGNGKYAFGFWYPSKVNWTWDTSPASCKPVGSVTFNDTELGSGKPKRTSGKYGSPGANGNLGVSEFSTTDGSQVHGVAAYQGSGWTDCTAKRAGYSRVGEWEVVQAAQRGWGKYNAGDRVPNGEYLVNFDFRWDSDTQAENAVRPTAAGSVRQNPNTTDIGATCPVLWKSLIRPGVCWALSATYEGEYNKIRVSRYRITPDDMIDARYIKVYGPKASR